MPKWASARLQCGHAAPAHQPHNQHLLTTTNKSKAGFVYGEELLVQAELSCSLKCRLKLHCLELPRPPTKTTQHTMLMINTSTRNNIPASALVLV